MFNWFRRGNWTLADPWQGNLFLAPLRAVWIVLCLFFGSAIASECCVPEVHSPTVALLAAFFACIAPASQLGVKPLEWRDLGAVVLFYIIMLLGMLVVTQWWDDVLLYYGIDCPQTQEAVRGISTEKSLFQRSTLFLQICILTPFVEEVLFRRIIYGGFRSVTAVLPALLMTSVIFSLAHFFIRGIPGLFVMGLMFNLIYLRRQNLLTAIILHILVNTMVFVKVIYSGA